MIILVSSEQTLHTMIAHKQNKSVGGIFYRTIQAYNISRKTQNS
jgi:hypothetical protein